MNISVIFFRGGSNDKFEMCVRGRKEKLWVGPKAPSCSGEEATA